MKWFILILIALLLMYMLEYNRLIKSEANLSNRLDKQKKYNKELIRQVAELTRSLNE